MLSEDNSQNNQQYREMRRKDRLMPVEKAYKLLENGEYGILSTIGENRQPYATPLSYVVVYNNIYFHCAIEGQKLDNIAFEPRVCFCVVGKTQPVYDKSFSTYFESVIVYGKAERIDDKDKKFDILMKLAKKYLPEHIDKAKSNIDRSIDITLIYKVSIEHITGKEKKM